VVALLVLVSVLSVLSAVVAIGINLGNVLDAPHEGDWAPPAKEYYFDDYRSRGFNLIRIPVRWDQHMSNDPPYTIDPTWMARVHTVVDWALTRGLPAIINSHHDDWIDDSDGVHFQQKLPRFVALWRQVAASFARYSSTMLSFEVYNELHVINVQQANQMYAATVPVMRLGGGANAARAIYLGGLSWMSPYWLFTNPDAIVPPPLASGAVDPNLHMQVHSYDPWAFCGEATAASWGTPADIAAEQAMYTNITKWLASHSRQYQSVLMGEAGCIVKAKSRSDRLHWYKVVADAAKASIGGRLTVWDDNGDFKIYNRDARNWDEGVMSALGL